MSEPIKPTWMTNEFFKQLLFNNGDHSAAKTELLKQDVHSAFKKGNNYLSHIFRINLEYTIESLPNKLLRKLSLIVKLPLTTGEFLPLIKDGGVVEKENRAYEELFPKLYKILEVGDESEYLAPKLFKSDIEHTLIMEDLSADGYKMADRKSLLDYEHSVSVIKHLAKFHAASVILHENEPDLIEQLGTDKVFNTNLSEEFKTILEPFQGEEHMEIICREFKKWPETRNFVDFILKLKPRVWDLHLSLLQPSDGEFTVLNHGDLWTNNVLFKYDSNCKPQKVKFVDFQFLRYTSPTLDLLTFFYSSIRYGVLRTHFHDLTKIYFDHLNSNLERLGSSKRLNEKEFKQSLEKRGLFSLIICLNLLPLTISEYDTSDEKSDGIPIGNFVENEAYRKLCGKHLQDFSKTEWYQLFERKWY